MMSDQEETEAFSETRSYRRGRASGERGRSRGRGGGKVTGKSRASESTGSDRQLTCYSAEDGTDYRIGGRWMTRCCMFCWRFASFRAVAVACTRRLNLFV